MERIRFISHQGRRVLLVDCSGCTAAEVATISDTVPQFVTQEPRESVLLLADFSDSSFTKQTVERLKLATVFDKPHLKRSAWVLTENLPKALYVSIRTFSGRDLPVFRTREEALEYLVAPEPAV
jgi:hypothetical protein